MTPTGRITVPESENLAAGSCVWRIIGTKGERVSLNISSLQLPNTRSVVCDKEKQNYLELRDGHYEKSRLIGICHITQKYHNETSTTRFLDNHLISHTEVCIIP